MVAVRVIDEYAGEDRKQVEALQAQVWPEADREHYGRDLPADFFATMKWYVIAEVEGKPVGYTSFDTEAGVAIVGGTCVLMRYRRQGIARKLKEMAEQKARELGCHKMSTTVGVGWASQHLNESLGYQRTCLLKRHFGGIDFYLYEKFLD